MTKEELLLEVEDLIRTTPPANKIGQGTQESLSWLGRAAAAINQWHSPSMVWVRGYIDSIQDGRAPDFDKAYANLMVMLHQARSELMMQTVGPLSVAVSEKMVFDYFDGLRKVIELAKIDILFVDPYLDAEFVSNYLTQVSSGVTIRLLTNKHLKKLVPAAKMFAAQNQTNLEIRSTQNIHDRFVFIDEAECYQSGASFKDGAKRAPTTFAQITDAFAPVFQTYQDMWDAANKEL